MSVQDAGKLNILERCSLLEQEKLSRALSRIARKFSDVSLENLVFEADLSNFDSALAYYEQEQFECKPEQYYRSSENIPQVVLSSPVKLSCGEVRDLSFPSGFKPTYKPFQNEFDAYQENKTAFARIWRHPLGESLGTIISIHGWMMGDSRLSALTLVPGFFFRLGLNVIVYELPYHGRRRPALRPGTNLFPGIHLARTNEGFAQAIYELRALAKWAEAEDHTPVGVLGLSLGGYTAALWASLDPLSFAILIAPLVSMSELGWQLLKKKKVVLKEISTILGVRLKAANLQKAYALHCPLSFEPKVPVEKRMILAGLGDKTIPPSQPKALWKHWDKPTIRWLSGSHLGQVVQTDTLNHVHDFLLSLNLAREKLLSVQTL